MINLADNAAIDSAEFLSFDVAVESMKNEIDKALSTSPMIIRKYTQHLMISKGKFIRAVSLITCAINKDGLVHPNAVKLAASVELLHLATLVHDDVIDNAKTRRGSATLQNKYGKRTAVICGDYLFCLALQCSSSITNRKDYINIELNDYMSRVCLGELTQHINNNNLDLSILTYLKIISGKTAALFEASFLAGIILCSDDEQKIEKYKKLGHYIGMIFQLKDDCIDFEASREQAKKTVRSDYDQGVITLPLIYTLKKLNGFKDRLKDTKINHTEMYKSVFESGGLTYTHELAKRYYDKALRIIEDMNESEIKKERLNDILYKSYNGLKK